MRYEIRIVLPGKDGYYESFPDTTNGRKAAKDFYWGGEGGEYYPPQWGVYENQPDGTQLHVSDHPTMEAALEAKTELQTTKTPRDNA